MKALHRVLQRKSGRGPSFHFAVESIVNERMQAMREPRPDAVRL